MSDDAVPDGIFDAEQEARAHAVSWAGEVLSPRTIGGRQAPDSIDVLRLAVFIINGDPWMSVGQDEIEDTDETVYSSSDDDAVPETI